jgi:hypothetical protein
MLCIFSKLNMSNLSKIGVDKIVYIIIKISNIDSKFCCILKIIITNFIS